jgi:hypothetical protein
MADSKESRAHKAGTCYEEDYIRNTHILRNCCVHFCSGDSTQSNCSCWNFIRSTYPLNSRDKACIRNLDAAPMCYVTEIE